ncbi:molybdopterin oxidoreductase family protein [Thermomonospora curvata]|uniref:Molybdopterin dinucleotide-binding region n=1 Tax=Thermomonospora curvata (strain ATCC 19995 / DSM 43183 / JCM 3096 / KCTC 9072 / NBRC 15933 / NCIMB 10081 / Henssen B9) TaxID=471852 RepID=D1A7C2_THECD|nr:molybdopterin oxidoreductase family protein [Thermomonospora curvata]ACZ00328.1 molybdopterin dinucleotide-binding region [Thermomonospora curvata DSM 43183]
MKRTAYRTCPLCEALCGLELSLDNDRVTKVRGDAADPLSKGFICPKGATLGSLDGDPDRLDAPLVRDGDRHVQTWWDAAFATVARQLRAVIERHGRDAVAVYIGNPNAHTVAGPLYNGALIRALGTRNVFSASTADQMPKHVSAGYMFGDPLAVPVPDLDRTDHLLMLGANPLESNGSLCSAPDFPGRLKAIRARGGRITVVDPRRTRTAALADQHIPIRPGTDAHLLFALVHTLFAEDLVQLGHLEGRVHGLDDLRALAVDFTPEQVADITGIRPLQIRRMARELAAAERAAVYGRIGTCTQSYGTLASWLVDVLNVLTGNLDRPGGAMFPRAAHIPLYRKKQPFTTGRWHSRVRGLPEVRGELPVAALAEEILTPGEGRIRALITIGGNPALSAPGSGRLEEALADLEFMVSVDPYLNETTRHAHVVLPPPRPTQSPHYDLALLNFTVRNYARYSPPAVPLPKGRPSEAEILARLALIASGDPDGDPAALDEMIVGATLAKAVTIPGSPVHGREPAELRKALTGRGVELRLDMMLRLGPYGEGFGADPEGLTLARLRDEHPHGIDLGPLEPRLEEVLCTASGLVELCPPTFAADAERLREGLGAAPPQGLVLIGRRHLRSNNSWLHNVPALVRGSNRCTLQLNPADAERLGINAGDTVRVTSRAGTLEAVAEPTDTVMAGVVSLPHGWGHDRPGTRLRVAGEHAGVNVNVVTDEQEVDPLSGNAVFNGVPVTVERVG